MACAPAIAHQPQYIYKYHCHLWGIDATCSSTLAHIHIRMANSFIGFRPNVYDLPCMFGRNQTLIWNCQRWGFGTWCLLVWSWDRTKMNIISSRNSHLVWGKLMAVIGDGLISSVFWSCWTDSHTCPLMAIRLKQSMKPTYELSPLNFFNHVSRNFEIWFGLLFWIKQRLLTKRICCRWLSTSGKVLRFSVSLRNQYIDYSQSFTPQSIRKKSE